jgi:hypothetical protein
VSAAVRLRYGQSVLKNECAIVYEMWFKKVLEMWFKKVLVLLTRQYPSEADLDRCFKHSPTLLWGKNPLLLL